jgi:formylmethanofuran dehydrogenase subunit B
VVFVAVCTGCSLLCEDIELALKTGAIGTKNLCRKGVGHFQALFTDRTVPMVEGKAVSSEEAISRAAVLLSKAERPLLFGWSNSTMEAQREGIALARSLGATIDDTSSFCQGLLLERVLRGSIPTCTLDDVRNFADVPIFWGSDPSNSHPRHLSRFSYYPRGERRQRSYEEERTSIAIDVRKSSTAKLCKYYYRVPPGGDAEFIASLNAVLDGKVPRTGDKKRMIELGTILRKADFGVIFPGLGLVYSLKEQMELLESLLSRMKSFRVIPMVGHYNMRGFNQLLLEEAGQINRVSFKDGTNHGPEHSVAWAAKSCDLALVVGSDPLSALPFGVARALARGPLIAIDPRRSLTTDAARVVIPSAISGLEAGGSALRMDGVKVEFSPVTESKMLSDADILTRIKEAV